MKFYDRLQMDLKRETPIGHNVPRVTSTEALLCEYLDELKGSIADVKKKQQGDEA